jgi:hypothetical protein
LSRLTITHLRARQDLSGKDVKRGLGFGAAERKSSPWPDEKLLEQDRSGDLVARNCWQGGSLPLYPQEKSGPSAALDFNLCFYCHDQKSPVAGPGIAVQLRGLLLHLLCDQLSGVRSRHFDSLEFWRQVLPGFSLPHNKQAMGWFLAVLAGVAIFVVRWPLRYLENRIEVAAYLAIGVAFMFTAGYARYLGLYWSRLVGGISITLGLHFLVDGVTKALMAYYRYHSPAFAFIRNISEIVSILAVVVWTIVILSPWGERQITEEELLKLEHLVDHMEADFIAAVRKPKFITGGGK